MNKTPFLIVFLFFASSRLVAQGADKIINPAEVEKIEKVLSADDMAGRASFSPGIERAANFIETQFRAAGLQTLNGGPKLSPAFLADRRQGRSGEPR